MGPVNGKLEFRSVKTRDMARLAAALESISPHYVMYYTGWAATRKGEVICTNIGWHQIFISSRVTERREFFRALVDNEYILIRPQDGVFDYIKVEFKEV